MQVHRLSGYLATVCSCAIIVGVWLMHMRGISVDVSGFMQTEILMSVWFLLTCLQAVLAARHRDHSIHQNWAMRHIASGIWVAVQRLLIAPGAVLGLMGVVDWSDLELRKLWFVRLAGLSWLICVGAVEVVIWRRWWQGRRKEVGAKTAPKAKAS